jgi:cation transport ATPase
MDMRSTYVDGYSRGLGPTIDRPEHPNISAELHTRPSGIKLSSHHEKWLWAVTATAFLSGLLWLVFHYFMAAPGEYGEMRNPLESWWLRLHGAAAMAFLVVLGSIVPIHIRRAWQLRKNRVTGAAMISLVAVLVLTGYALYYAGSEMARPWISLVHLGFGLMGLPMISVHVLIGQRRTAAMLRARSKRKAPSTA